MHIRHTYKIQLFNIQFFFMHDTVGFFLSGKPIKFWYYVRKNGLTVFIAKHYAFELIFQPVKLNIKLCIFGRHRMTYSHTTHDGADHYKCAHCTKTDIRSFDGYRSHYRQLDQGSRR